MPNKDYAFVHRHLIDPAPKWRDQRNPLPAVFLDRDGTINHEVHYLSRVEDLELIPGAAKAIARLNKAGIPVIVITNQSGIARGILNEDDLLALHEALVAMLAAQGAHVQGFYFSPYHPDGQGDYKADSDCRKPEPGMLLAACEDFAIQPEDSVMIGDKLVDVVAGKRAGARTVLVRTGHGKTESAMPEATQADFIAEDLPSAVEKLFADGLLKD
jgi:D-glycero-D-manno-heptose 1,7-bisphosphate phosphatase